MTGEDMGPGEYVEVVAQAGGDWYRIEHRTQKEAEAGFDCTVFDTPEDFEELLERHDLADGFAGVEEPESNRDAYPTWSNEDVMLIAKCNPLTGVSADPARRTVEEGYASLIGLQGTQEAVDALYDDIRETAAFIDGGSNREARDFI